jgi:hypothetical protein
MSFERTVPDNFQNGCADHASRLKRGFLIEEGCGAWGVLGKACMPFLLARTFVKAKIVLGATETPNSSCNAPAISTYVQRRCRSVRINSVYGSSLLAPGLGSARPRKSEIFCSRLIPAVRRQHSSPCESGSSLIRGYCRMFEPVRAWTSNRLEFPRIWVQRRSRAFERVRFSPRMLRHIASHPKNARAPKN